MLLPFHARSATRPAAPQLRRQPQPRCAPRCHSVAGPPAGFSVAEATAEDCAALAAAHPLLAPIIAEGVVTALRRPTGVPERRSDGYREPSLVVVIGVAHLSTRSPADVRHVISVLRPQCVVVELCRSRQQQLYGGGGGGSSSPFALTGDGGAAQGLLPALQRALRLGGGGALLLRAAMAAVANKATGNGSPTRNVPGGVVPAFGSEFTAAREAAEEVSAQVVLGDRPLEITLQRAIAATTWADRAQGLGLVTATLSGNNDTRGGGLVTASAMDALVADGQAVDALLTGFTSAFPKLATALVHERDAYLAWSLCRSKAVDGTDVVVGVVGKAHVRGIVWAMQAQRREQLRFDTLTGRGAAERRQRPLWQRLAVDVALWGVLPWALWQLYTSLGSS